MARVWLRASIPKKRIKIASAILMVVAPYLNDHGKDRAVKLFTRWVMSKVRVYTCPSS